MALGHLPKTLKEVDKLFSENMLELFVLNQTYAYVYVEYMFMGIDRLITRLLRQDDNFSEVRLISPVRLRCHL